MSASVQEKVAVFGDARGLVGILTRPASGATPGMPHVVLLNSGIIHRVGSNRLSVELARALGAAGVTTLRFDLSGIGDSERRRDAGSLRESVERDIGDAVAYLRTSQGAETFVLMGLCSGAYDGLHAALGEPRVVGAVMVDIPGPFRGWRHTLHHLRARLLRPASWRNPFRKLLHYSRALALPGAATPSDGAEYVVGGRSTPSREWMSEHLDALLDRSVRLWFVFTGGIEANYNHRSQFRTTFPKAARHPALSYDYFPDTDHAFSARESRTRLIGMTVQWVLKEPFSEGATAGPTRITSMATANTTGEAL